MATSRVGKARIQKMGTRAGKPHYGVDCLSCPGAHGMDSVLSVGHISDKAVAKQIHADHVANDHGRAPMAGVFNDRRDSKGPWM